MRFAYTDDVRQAVTSQLENLLAEMRSAQEALQTTLEEELRRVRYAYINQKTCEILTHLEVCARESRLGQDKLPMVYFAERCVFFPETLALLNDWCENLQDKFRNSRCFFDVPSLRSIDTGAPEISDQDFDQIVAAFHTFSQRMEEISSNWKSFWANAEENALLDSLGDYVVWTCIAPMCQAAEAGCIYADQCKEYFIQVIHQQQDYHQNTVNRNLNVDIRDTSCNDSSSISAHGAAHQPAPAQLGTVGPGGTAGSALSIPAGATTGTQPSAAAGTQPSAAAGTQPSSAPGTQPNTATEFDWTKLQSISRDMLRCEHLSDMFNMFNNFYSEVISNCEPWLTTPMSVETVQSQEMKNLYEATRYALANIAQQYIVGNADRRLAEIWDQKQARNKAGLLFMLDSVASATESYSLPKAFTQSQEGNDFLDRLFKIGNQAKALLDQCKNANADWQQLLKTQNDLPSLKDLTSSVLSTPTKTEDFHDFWSFHVLLDHRESDSAPKVLYTIATFLSQQMHLKREGSDQAVYSYHELIGSFQKFARIFLNGESYDLQPPASVKKKTTWDFWAEGVESIIKRDRMDWTQMQNYLQQNPIHPQTQDLAGYVGQSFFAVELARNHVDSAENYREVEHTEMDNVNASADRVARYLQKVPLTGIGSAVLQSTIQSVKFMTSGISHQIVDKTLLNKNIRTDKAISKLRKQMQNDALAEELCAGADLKTCGIQYIQEKADTEPADKLAVICAAYLGTKRFMEVQKGGPLDLQNNQVERGEFIQNASKALSDLRSELDLPECTQWMENILRKQFPPSS